MKRMLIAGAALLLVTVMNGQSNPTVAPAAEQSSRVPGHSVAILEKMKTELGLDESQAAKASQLLRVADKESANSREMCATMMKNVDATYDKTMSMLASSLTPEQARKFEEMKAQGLLKGACCADTKGCGDMTTGKKAGCCAGDAGAPGKTMAAPRPTTPAER